MRKSKLDSCQEILKAIEKQPLTLSTIAFACNIDRAILQQRIDFLIESHLVNQELVDKKTCFSITPKGLTILKTLLVTHLLERLQTSVRIENSALCSFEPLELNALTQNKKY
jgi:predicted transcriptional regulator